MKIVMLGSYPLYRFAKQLGIGPNDVKRITSWNETLAEGVAKEPETEVHFITSTRAIPKTRSLKKGRLQVTFFVSPPRINMLTFYQYTRCHINRMLNDFKPDIVHGIGTEHIWPSIAISSKYPAVVTVHGIMSEIVKKVDTPISSPKRFFAFLEKKVLKKTKYLISISPYVERSLGKYTNAVIYSIENPISEIFHSINAMPDKNNNILFVGDIQPWKDLLTLIRAFRKLKDSNIRLIIVGAVSNMAYYEKLKEVIHKLNIKDRIIYKGFLLPDELKEEYKNAAFLVLSSIAETAPMCVAEAMSAGIPIIASDIAGIPYMIKDGKSGFLFPAGDVSRLRDLMKILIENPQLRDEMGKEGKKIAMQRWQPGSIALQTIDVYESILRDHNRA